MHLCTSIGSKVEARIAIPAAPAASYMLLTSGVCVSHPENLPNIQSNLYYHNSGDKSGSDYCRLLSDICDIDTRSSSYYEGLMTLQRKKRPLDTLQIVNITYRPELWGTLNHIIFYVFLATMQTCSGR